MHPLILLLVFLIFASGVLTGLRCAEINLRGRERRLSEDRRWVNDRLCALQAHHDMNDLIWQAQDELRQTALMQAQDMPFILEPQTRTVTPSQRNSTKDRPRVNGRIHRQTGS
jgi:hypothetical protein